ncbi:heat shock 70 kDa protein 14-like [Asterias rubens]|uniref:heat shock 70 kDa protein 14-like n=1 Tax=Asterias rubens TaxID=7604 RepID=UPI0014550E68|nr:heat shock 70 kDa protein 14-like [Asterias rubens]
MALFIKMAASMGISFGGSTTCLAIFKDGKTEVIANDAGDRVTPAIVAYNGKDKDVGIAAKQGRIRNSVNTISGVKHVLGRKFDDPVIQRQIQAGPTKIVDQDGCPVYEVEFKEKATQVKPKEVAALIFKKIKDIASNQGGSRDERDVVLTAPLDYSEASCSTLRQVACDAGFNVLRVISEPAAAALAYGLCDAKSLDKSHVLVYRLGGTSLSVSILQVSSGMLRVIASQTDRTLGGDEFTLLLAKSCAADFNRTQKCNILNNDRAMKKLLSACENSKHILSTLPTAKCSIDSLYDGMDFHTGTSRVKFESLISGNAQQSIQVIRQLLASVDMTPDQIQKVMFVGGSTRIPKLQQMIKDAIPKAEVLDSISPDEIMAIGAAKEAALLSSRGESIELTELDINASCCPKAIAVKVSESSEDASLEIVVPQFSFLPIRRQHEFNVGKDQTSVCIQIYGTQEGASDQEASLLAQIVIDGLETESEEEFHVTSVFHYRRDGSLHVTCSEEITGQTQDVMIGPPGHVSSQSEHVSDELREA